MVYFDGVQLFNTYGPWGESWGVSGTLASTLGAMNPLRYRGYVCDAETGLYYLNSRYYNPTWGRFINADSVISVNSSKGTNMFSYCFNNPITMEDPSGNWPQWIKNAYNRIKTKIENVVKKIINFIKPTTAAASSSHDDNRRPNKGSPGSTYHAPNGDSRTYGPDGRPQRDYDHDDHGQPDKHPHDENGGHFHDWDWSNKKNPRGPAYVNMSDILVGVGLVSVCAIGLLFVAADDLTGIGVADDFLFGPLSAGVGKGLLLIFG